MSRSLRQTSREVGTRRRSPTPIGKKAHRSCHFLSQSLKLGRIQYRSRVHLTRPHGLPAYPRVMMPERPVVLGDSLLAPLPRKEALAIRIEKGSHTASLPEIEPLSIGD